MHRNIRLYSWYFALSSFLAWMPIFFLYFSEHLSLSEVLRLEALYYIVVVILEVPSGYFSDRIGRKSTLMIGAILLCLAILFYIIGAGFWSLALGQFFFAAHMSFVSGTNTVFHFESLKSIGKDKEYGPREAQVNQWALLSGGIGALLGGYLGGYDLVYAYWLSLLASIIALIITFMFINPEVSREDMASNNFFIQIKQSISQLIKPQIRWVFTAFVLMFVMVHMPYEFYQPYLDLLDQNGSLTFSSAPVMSGILYAAAMFIGSLAAGKSVKWKNRIGFKPFISIMAVFMVLIIGLMGLYLHSAIVSVILMRSFSWSAVKAPIYEILTPNIDAGQRATFYSLMSLVSRLGFFLLLFSLSFVTPQGHNTDWPSLSLILKICGLISLIFTVYILVTIRKVDFK